MTEPAVSRIQNIITYIFLSLGVSVGERVSTSNSSEDMEVWLEGRSGSAEGPASSSPRSSSALALCGRARPKRMKLRIVFNVVGRLRSRSDIVTTFSEPIENPRLFNTKCKWVNSVLNSLLLLFYYTF